MALTAEFMISLWDRAKEAEIGIAVAVEGPLNSFVSQMNQTRKQLDEPELREIAITMPEGGKEVWLVKKETQIDD